jgi:toxin FitB
VSFLLDTSIISELTRAMPDVRVLRWLAKAPGTTLYLSVLTLGELHKGVSTLMPISRRDTVLAWLEQDLPGWFEPRIVPIDAAVTARWGQLLAEIGRPIPAVESLLAASALHCGLKLVTRNVLDFNFPGLTVINPWSR